MRTLIANLRLVFDFSLEDVAQATHLDQKIIQKMEEGGLSPSRSLSDFYANTLSINKHIFEIFLLGTPRKVPFFDGVRSGVKKSVNSYLTLAIWMESFGK
tara:strand:+ start:743 stop:1042 length:300 start_codon:yes stop_codon:yes gene_type:complete